ncbi:alpha/beta hydrolase [Wenzhouxiangella sediminis]|uniref:Alpha/beta hydrolase n=1 Tax=Wenzhouxiangella sediminis TaxID=1792836 RepID=A0A3E1K7I7_9GAMM|nr:alpha/beta hydrolase-fold protein [Wenzhouxiangella sediminis]RFF29984.1 alpha/beta hydrolase [Wenzhouxiangella sediminis]
MKTNPFRYGALLLLFIGIHALAGENAGELAIGETFTLHSEQLEEERRINVFQPTVYGEAVATPLPVLYMLDGGIDEDFLHIAGLLQVFVSNGSVRPLLLVGIENTERRRDMTGPSDDPQDQAIAEHIGGAAAFRSFLRDELIETIESRYDVTPERAIIGESLAGLFVVETLANEPGLFDTYIAVDPSVWWNQYDLTGRIAQSLQQESAAERRLFVAASEEASSAERFQAFIVQVEQASSRMTFEYAPMPQESHATLFHPAAMKAFRTMFSASAED